MIIDSHLQMQSTPLRVIFPEQITRFIWIVLTGAAFFSAYERYFISSDKGMLDRWNARHSVARTNLQIAFPRHSSNETRSLIPPTFSYSVTNSVIQPSFRGLYRSFRIRRSIRAFETQAEREFIAFVVCPFVVRRIFPRAAPYS